VDATTQPTRTNEGKCQKAKYQSLTRRHNWINSTNWVGEIVKIRKSDPRSLPPAYLEPEILPVDEVLVMGDMML